MRSPLLVFAFGALSCQTPEDEPLPRVCNAGSSWSEGQTAFADASDAWGLSDINAAGVLVSAVDFDGDGWTDLAVRHFNAAEDFSEGGTRSTWLLRNVNGRSFEDVTQSSGIIQLRGGSTSDTAGRFGPVWSFGDVDNDGDLDVFTGSPIQIVADPAFSSEIMLNQGDGTFGFGPEDSTLRRSRDDYSSGASFVDFDRDGNLDLFVSQYNVEQDLLYRGDGQGDFDEVMDEAGTTTVAWRSAAELNTGQAHTNAWSANACDLNNDGWPELLASSYGRAPNHLWQANGDGTYTNASVASGYAFDDRQDWSDNESARCWCTLYPNDPDCAGVPAPATITCSADGDAFRWNHTNDRELYRLGGNSGATTCADINNDGWLDLMTSEIVHWDVGSSSDPSELLINQGQDDILFTRPGNEKTGLTRTTTTQIPWDNGDITNSVFDFDNDGWKDIYIGASEYPGNRGLLYRQTSPEQFAPVPIEDGVDHFRSHGSAVADFDRDGDLDLVVGHSRSRCDDDCYETFGVRLFENQLDDSNFIQLRLEGSGTTNRSAIGARVEVTVGDVTQVQEVNGGHGHYGSQNDLILHFGLGEGCTADVSIRWPNADLTTQTFSVGGGYRYHVRQGQEPTAELP